MLDEMPPLADFEPFGVYCSWEITLDLADTATEATIAEVFEFVEGNCDLVDRAARHRAPPPQPTLRRLPAMTRCRSFADLCRDAPRPSCGFVRRRRAETLCRLRRRRSRSPITPAGPTVARLPSDDDGRPPRPARATARSGVQSIRVDLDKVDRVVNMVGELVITQSMLTQQMDETLRARYQELVRGLEVLAQTTRGLQDAVMAIRAQPVKSVFSPHAAPGARAGAARPARRSGSKRSARAPRSTRRSSSSLSDPLTHMIRNSADHGIETPEKRLAARQARDRHDPAFGRAGGRQYPHRRRGRRRRASTASACCRWRATRGVVGPDQQLDRRADRPADLCAGLFDRRGGLRHFRPRRRHGRGALQHQEDRRLGACAELDRARARA